MAKAAVKNLMFSNQEKEIRAVRLGSAAWQRAARCPCAPLLHPALGLGGGGKGVVRMGMPERQTLRA